MRYAVRRVAAVVPMWFALTLLAFILGNLAPGDPANAYFQRTRGRPPTPTELTTFQQQYNLDGSAGERYLDWVTDAVRGDLGRSYSTGRPVSEEFVSRMGPTFQLATSGMVVALLIALPVGVITALHRNRWLDQVLRAGAILGASVPGFVLAYFLIIVFAVELGLLPAIGRGSLRHLVLPALALGLGEAGILSRLMRSSLLEVLNEPWVRAARARGLSERRVIWRHGVLNALAPVVTEAGLVFGFLIATSAIIEIIFVWPGMGRLVLDAIAQRDYPVLQGFVVFAGTVYVVLNVIVDLVYTKLDPRVALWRSADVAALR